MTRPLCCALTALTLGLLAPASAQPTALGHVAARDAAPAAVASVPRPAPSASERRSALSVEVGGMSLVAGLRFDHDLGRHVRLSVGASTLTTGEFVTQRVVFAPVSVSGVWPMSRRWSAEAGVGVILAGGWDTGDSAVLGGGLVVEPDPTFKLRALRPMPTAGVRYAAGPLQVRGGVAVHSTRVGQPERTWVLPWPTVSAGVRF